MIMSNEQTPFAPPPPPAVSATTACETLQDWLAVAKPPVREGSLENCVAVFNAGDAAADSILAVAPGTAQLLHLRPPKTGPAAAQDAAEAASEGGWVARTVAVPDTRKGDDRWPRGPISRVTAFGNAGIPFALVQFDEVTDAETKRNYLEPMTVDPATGNWKKWPLPDRLAQILVSASQTEVFYHRGRATLYTKPTGTSKDDDVFAFVFHHSGDWTVAEARFPVRPGKTATFRLLANDDDHPNALGTLLRLGDGNVVELMRVRLETPEDETPYIDHPKNWQRRTLTEFGGGNVDAARLIPLPERPGAFALHAADGHVWLVSDFESERPRVTRLTGTEEFPSAASELRVSLDVAPARRSAPQVVLFAVEATPDRRVWVARETQADPPTFGAWVPLGEQVRALASAPRIGHGTEFFLVSEGKGTALERRSLDPSGETWHSAVVESAKPEQATETTTHTARIEVRTGSGALAPRATVGIEASFPCVAVVHGMARHLAPGSVLRTAADDSGQLLVRIPADGPHAPVLTVHLADGRKLEVATDEAVARRLAGKEEHHAVDERRLESVRLLPAAIPPAQRAELVDFVRKAGNQVGLRRTDASLLAEATPEWSYGELVPSEDGGVTWRFLHGEGSLPPELLGDGYEEAVISLSGAEPHIKWGFAGDFLNWFVSTGQKLAKWAVAWGKKAAEFTLWIGSKPFAITLSFAQGIVRGAEAVFRGICAAVNHAVDVAKAVRDAVRSVFDAGAIRRTNECLQLCLDSGLGLVEGMLRTKLRESFDTIVDRIVAGIDEPLGAIEQYMDGLTLGGVAGKGIPDKEDGASGVPGRGALLQKAGVQARWMADRVAANPRVIHDALAAQVFAVDEGTLDRLKELAGLMKSDEPGRDSIFGLFLDKSKELEQLFSEKVISGTGVVALLRWLRGLLRRAGDLTKRAMALIFDLLADGVRYLREALKIRILIPGLDQLAQLVLGRSMVIGDLLTMLIAVPATILWKAVTRGEEPVPQARLDVVRKTLKDQWGARESDNIIVDFFLAYAIWQAAKLVGTKVPHAEATLRRLANGMRGFIDAMIPVATVLQFGTLIGSVLIDRPVATIADTMDSLSTYGAGSQTLGFMSKLFLVAAVVIAAFGVWANAVQTATIALLPDTEHAKKWKQQRTLVEPLDWMSLSWLISLILSVVNLLCLKALPSPTADFASLGMTTLLGAHLFVGGGIYTTLFIHHNKDKIRGWRIAKEIGALVGTIPSLFKAVPGVINVTMGPSGGLSALMLPPYCLAVTVCNQVSNITATGSLIDENMAQKWSQFHPPAPLLAEVCA
jgi:hypothetical protein